MTLSPTYRPRYQLDLIIIPPSHVFLPLPDWAGMAATRALEQRARTRLHDTDHGYGALHGEQCHAESDTDAR